MRSPFLFGITLLFVATPSLATQYVFPAEGQTPEQQQQDEYACHQWSVQQTGYDPSRAAVAAPAAAPATTHSNGQVGRGVLGGAARGYAIGAIADGDKGDAAAAGAVFGGLRSAREARHRQELQAAQASQQSASSQGAHQQYLKARAACLEGRGYSVK